ncbi:ABC transporter permease [Streptomyces sulfonofaciens]|uniref:ABC transporter permease n=1 Tax=Streptomyces sulfonofaciens TaxID=68272 RepID=A0A919L4W1_9ACTN|nr:ABC transporter ATP-binding protein [Streptomyces sulfonofaciens]GHH83922.1 ABC transporter permease [Streptomyces sulfonofaciens]
MKAALLAVLDLARVSWAVDRRRLVTAVVLMMAEACALPLAAAALGVLTDRAVSGDVEGAALAGGVAAVAAIVGLTGGHFAHIFYLELGELNLLRLDRDLIDVTNGSATLGHHERPEVADRLAVLKEEFTRIPSVGMSSLLTGTSLVVAMVINGVLLGRVNPWLLLLPLAALPSVHAGRHAESLMQTRRHSAASPTRTAQHVLRLARTAAFAKELRVLGLREELTARHGRHWQEATRILRGGQVRASAWRTGGHLCFALAYAGAMLLVTRAAVAGEQPVGSIVLVVVLAMQINAQVGSAITLLQEWQRMSGTLASFRQVKKLVLGADRPPATARLPERMTHGIRVRLPHFAYPGTDRPALTDVDLLLPAGSTVAVVGENGAGKTTLVKLLCRFYDTTSGTIEVDGVDLADVDPLHWRSRISAGFQDFSRFELVARQTVGVGDLPRVDDDGAVSKALDLARASDVFARLDDGPDTPLGHSLPGGRELSGGQWQKLAIGRSMMRQDPLLLVLDEPTAALDARAEHQVFERYAENARRIGRRTGAVTVLVSHRFSTVRDADLILVVAGSRIAESGTHSELMKENGLYAELYTLQARQYS